MKASARGLDVFLQADAQEKIPVMQFIIDDHLRRFARFETLSYQWEATVPEAIKPELNALIDTGSPS